MPVDVLLAFGSAVVWYSIASAFRCFVRGCTSVLGFGFGCSCSSLLAQPHSSTLCSLLCVVPVPLHAPRAAHTHLTHRTRRSLTTQYPHTSYTTHHAHHTNTSHHPSLTLAHTQVWDGMLLVVYLGCTPVLDQVRQIYPMLCNPSQVKTSYTKSYPHKYTYKDTHKDTHKYAAYRYTFIQLYIQIHVPTYATNTPTKNAHKYTYS